MAAIGEGVGVGDDDGSFEAGVAVAELLDKVGGGEGGADLLVEAAELLEEVGSGGGFEPVN